MVEPTINNCNVSRVLMDGGSSLNILFVDALDAMHLSRSAIKPVTQSFHGIVQGCLLNPLARSPYP